MAIKSLGCDAVSFTGPQVGIVTDNVHTRARILSVSSEKIRREQAKGKVVVVAGFQGVNIHEDITTLGRGGSDTTAIALAAALDADICEIYTDVEGVYTADPRIVPEARKLSTISYDAMLEYASLGAKVLNLRAVEFAKNHEVPIHVRSSFNKEGGTIVTGESEEMEKLVLNGVAYDRDEAKITIQGVPDQPGVAFRTFQAVADAHINVDMIVQNVSVAGKTDLSFTVTRSDLPKVLEIVEKVAQGIGAKGVISDKDIAKVSIVGVGMRSHPGVAAKMFGALAECGINIQMISTSEIKISCIIEEKHVEKAVRAIHEKFELGS
jgi:aspartate kinase